MTRRSDKQQESAYYLPDGNAGEVWLAWGVDVDSEEWERPSLPFSADVLLDVFATEQTANHFALWRHRSYGLHGDAPKATKRVIRTEMRLVC